MKIIQVAPYYPPHIGGVENVVKEISERLAKKGCQVEVFTSNIGCKKGKLPSKENLRINYLQSCEFAHTPIMPALFFKLLKVSRNSIIHVHFSQAFIPEMVYLISKIKKIPFIVQLHSDTKPSSRFGVLLPFYKKFFIKKILSDAHRIICLSEEYKQFITKKYGINERKIMVIPNGVNDSYFIDKEKNFSNLTNLLYVGRLSVQKNLLKLIEAVSLIESKVVLDIVGEGEKKREIEDKILEKKLNNVILHGRKTGQDLINFYQKADIFILTSDDEGLPLVLLEALASGTPIVTSDLMGIREFFKDISILVNPATPENFARKIEGLINNKEKRARLAEEGRGKAHGFRWDKIIDKYEDAYKSVAANN